LNSLLIPDRDKEADLKIEFLACLERCQAQRHALRGVIQRAFRLGHTRADLIEWGVSANCSRACMRKIISPALLQAGLRSRKRGAGPSHQEKLWSLSLSLKTHTAKTPANSSAPRAAP